MRFLVNALQCASDKFNDKVNRRMLLRTIHYIESTEHFESPLFKQC